ncbi:hypothetical protein EBR77_03335 [bacterium]|nr:hypothetical protein [bacterium]
MKKQFLLCVLLGGFISSQAAQEESFIDKTFSALSTPAGLVAIVLGATLISRPLLGYVMQLLSQEDIEKYNIWELISVHTGKDYNDLPETDLNIGGLRLKVTMLDTEAVKKYGILGASVAVINATDPALSRAFVERIRNAVHLKKTKAAKEELEAQKNQWALNIQANLLNFGVQTRIALSEMILTTTGLLALAALQGMLDKATVVDQGADATTPTV